MKAKAHEVEAWVGGLKADKSPALVLVYGPDRGGVHETAKAIKAAYLGQDFDPLQYVSLEEGALSGQAGLLADEAAAMPMFGDRKLVHVSGANAAVVSAVKFYLAKLAEVSEATGKGGYGQIYNDLVMDVGFNLRSSEQSLETAKAMYDSAVDRKSKFSGVDLDTEAARLLEQQQAYQALAKVLSTAKEMVDTLLRFM